MPKRSSARSTTGGNGPRDFNDRLTCARTLWPSFEVLLTCLHDATPASCFFTRHSRRDRAVSPSRTTADDRPAVGCRFLLPHRVRLVGGPLLPSDTWPRWQDREATCVCGLLAGMSRGSMIKGFGLSKFEVRVAARSITLRGVAVHNLKEIDLDIPRRKLVVLCGLSGSGKTSLALDTLYAEGQRRYIDSFSAYTRQFLERLEKPAAERIDGIPPAIAVTHKNTSRSNRSTVGTATETSDYLRLLFAKIGQLFCTKCGHAGASRHAANGGRRVGAAAGRGPLSCGLWPPSRQPAAAARCGQPFQEKGFLRRDRRPALVNLGRRAPWSRGARAGRPAGGVLGRWSTGWRPATASPTAAGDSLETAFAKGRRQVPRFLVEYARLADGRMAAGPPRIAQSTAGHGSELASAAIALRHVRPSTIPSPSRGCSASTVRWGLAPTAKALAT